MQGLAISSPKCRKLERRKAENWSEQEAQSHKQQEEMAPEPPAGGPARGGGLIAGPAKLPVLRTHLTTASHVDYRYWM